MIERKAFSFIYRPDTVKGRPRRKRPTQWSCDKNLAGLYFLEILAKVFLS